MSFQHTLKIPKERIGALIGKRGKVKLQIEKKCGVEIEIDSETGDALIKSTRPAEQVEAFRAVEVITAISRGFSPERAYRLFEDEEIFGLFAWWPQASRRNPCFLIAELCRAEHVRVERQRWDGCQVDPCWREGVFAL